MAKTGKASGETLRLPAAAASAFMARLFQAYGISEKTAREVADGLVEADLAGVGSHGMLQAPNYLRRIAAGTISRAEDMSLVHESGAVAVYDAGLMLGHPAATRAMDAAIARAGRFGIAAVAVRSATHFGVTGSHARRAADAGMIGIAMCNTRPMMPAPGGAEPVVGNNPLAIALPSKGEGAVVFDMAMSEAAMGKIRAAAAKGEPIPQGWALDTEGRTTTDPRAAIGGMLLPSAGPKGFGLAFMIDLLCGLLSDGSHGDGLAPMFGPPEAPADCSWLLIAVDPAHFGLSGGIAAAVRAAAEKVRGAKRQEGVDRLFVPGDRKRQVRENAGNMIAVAPAVLSELNRIASQAGIDPMVAAADA